MRSWKEIERQTHAETLALKYGGPGPQGKWWQIVRLYPSERIFRIEYRVTHGKADPHVTELPKDWDVSSVFNT